MNTKCRLCRRKTDPDRMLLCDGCDRGHHMYCLKPAMKKVPEGDWFCPECKPKERIRSPKKKVRSRFSMCEEEDEDADEDEDDVQEDSSPPAKKSSKSRKKLRIVESDEEDEEEEEPKPRKDKKKTQKKKAVVESDEDEDEEEETPPRRGGRSRKKVHEEEEEEMDSPPPKKKGKETSKKGLSNLFGRRQAAVKSDERRRGEVEEEAEDDDEEEEQEARSRSSRRARSSKDQENKENSRAKGKRGRGEDHEEEDLDLNVGEMDELLKALMKHKDGWPFDRPITKQDAPDYHLCVKTPIDLSTIRTRLDGTTYYTRNQEILDDIRLVFSNCFQYNQEDADEYKCALRLEKYFDKELSRVGLVDESQYPKIPKSKKRRA